MTTQLLSRPGEPSSSSHDRYDGASMGRAEGFASKLQNIEQLHEFCPPIAHKHDLLRVIRRILCLYCNTFNHHTHLRDKSVTFRLTGQIHRPNHFIVEWLGFPNRSGPDE